MNSMTAYARQSEALMLGRVTWEVRSVNHRFLDVSVHLPDPLRGLEPAVRTAVKQHVRRGKVDVALKCQWHANGVPGSLLLAERERGHVVVRVFAAGSCIR